MHQQIPPRFPFEQRTRAELRFYRDIDYTKNALGFTQILNQLKAIGLLFNDEERAVEVLANISYFRIANYLRYFEIDNVRHLYKPDTYFEDAVYIYHFDKQLRSLLFTGIQSIEVSRRSKVIHHVALSHGPFWFTDSNLCINRVMYADNLTAIKRERCSVQKRISSKNISENIVLLMFPQYGRHWRLLLGL